MVKSLVVDFPSTSDVLSRKLPNTFNTKEREKWIDCFVFLIVDSVVVTPNVVLNSVVSFFLLNRWFFCWFQPKMSLRLGAIALVLALCAVSVHSQVWGYVSQSFSLVRSDNLEPAHYELVANISNRGDGEVMINVLIYRYIQPLNWI